MVSLQTNFRFRNCYNGQAQRFGNSEFRIVLHTAEDRPYHASLVNLSIEDHRFYKRFVQGA